MSTPIAILQEKAQALLSAEQPSKALLKLTKGAAPEMKDCQLFVARQFGFKNWAHAEQVFSDDSCTDYGGLWYKEKCAFMLNNWCISYEEAKTLQQKIGGILLPYKHQFMVVGKQFLTFLGMDSEDPQWAEIDHDFLLAPAAIRQALLLKRVQAG